MNLSLRTPLDDGLFMPAEWEPHERCWMQWPSRSELWGPLMPRAYAAYASVARAIATFEPVSMVVRPDDVAQAQLACGRNPQIEFVPIEIDDSWARDTGPVFLTDGSGSVAGVHWRFNAWGNEYSSYGNDAAVGSKILHHLQMRCYGGPMIFEGGSICVDGEGTVLTTEECLLNDNRNPDMTRQQIEEALVYYLGVRKIIWLDQGLEDDETNGHVDMIACFARPGVVLLAMPTDPQDPNYERMQENKRRLEAAHDGMGRSLSVVEVPLPERDLLRDDGRRLCRSYINFYIANGGIVMPTFEDPQDRVAAEVIASQFPDRKLVTVPGLDIALGGGVVHCITQQQPAGQALR